MPDAIRIPAYAKVNLSLEVIGRRDDGYHEIVTIMQTVSLADTLAIRQSATLIVECDAPGLEGDSNLVWRAAVALAERAGVAPRARISIAKRIPVAAGLGGGSADAAAALRGLNRLWGLDWPDAALSEIAAGIGSDVPFLLNGGTALAAGRGECIVPLSPPPPDLELLLIAPAAGMAITNMTIPNKTPTLYGALTPGDFSDGRQTRRLFASAALAAGALTTRCCRNAFTRAAQTIFPGLAGVWSKTAAIAAHPPVLSGAGPSIFCAPSQQGERNAVAHALRDTGATAYLVRTINPANPDADAGHQMPSD